jgi:hypothetical protein
MTPDQPKQPTIDERLQALTMNLELQARESQEARERMDRLDARERRAREALLSGIAAYLRALQDEDVSPDQ